MRVLGLILAGGASRRMEGLRKDALVLNGRSLLDHVCDVLRPQTATLALSFNADPRLAGLGGIAILPDGKWAGAGPLAGLRSGLAWAGRSGFDALVSLPVDCPFAPDDLVECLSSGLPTGGGPALAASPKGAEEPPMLHPAIGLWPVSLCASLEQALENGTRKVTDWTIGLNPATVPFAFAGHDPFFNINRPEDLAEAARIAVSP